ncbi:Tyrosine-protein phosphatase YwqE [Lishizhenia tianjinensis]|uniref:protein-tyrosine-phosphatase n=1 Tax=Lishizhenia tianjinensis TaxID=477690 RepID=A0A1I7ANZ1_9FLAO|nr:CpsB/CapC family capsule biosynthesis tyrosine phosphatase [Lishizhenia tianjinensis]SFT76585.1 Tyrosine-protein phosphatase YwqE [Lishizhenia tianjinensis]
MFSLFKKKEAKVPVDLSRLGIDVHSHLIPGIDDGAQNVDASIGMLTKFKALGYNRIITTPHVYSDLYPNTTKSITDAYNVLLDELEKTKLDIQVEVAAEYFFDETFLEKIENDDVLSWAGNHVLFEFSFTNEPMGIDGLIFQLQTKGYIPVLAHFERYLYYHGSVEKARELRDKGVLIQVNLNSLTGHYGPHIKKQAELLIDNKLVDLAGTDCHRIEHLQLLESHLKRSYFHKLLDLDLLNYRI